MKSNDVCQIEEAVNVHFRFVEGICPNKECGYEDARGDQVNLGKVSLASSKFQKITRLMH